MKVTSKRRMETRSEATEGGRGVLSSCPSGAVTKGLGLNMMNAMKRFVNIFIGTTLALLAQFSFSCADAKVRQYKVQVVKEYIHDETSFTQGLFFLDGEMIETTGQYGESTLYGSEDLRDNPLHFE